VRAHDRHLAPQAGKRGKLAVHGFVDDGVFLL
jgi:hypothetical protein